MAQSAPDHGQAFEPRPLSEPLYGTTAAQTTYVAAGDGAATYVETYLPAAKDGRVPPERVPAILAMSPYERPGGVGGPTPDHIAYYTARGYAFAIAHVRGTGRSGGCLDLHGTGEVDATARVIEYLGRDAPWAAGSVGMMGVSYLAATQIGAAAFGDPQRTKYLKAIVPIAPVTSTYDFLAFDGMSFDVWNDAAYRVYTMGTTTLLDQRTTDAGQLICDAHLLGEARPRGGDFTEWDARREHRRDAASVRPAVLFIQGLLDFNGHVRSPVGFFDRLPPETPRKAIIGQWDHADPSGDNPLMAPVNRWPRADFAALELAWFDRWLKGLPTGAEHWPEVQVQGIDGQWREEPDWPTTGGPAGQLALGANGDLGAASPAGETSFLEESVQGEQARGIEFSTAPLPEPLAITGQPELELWVVLDRPAAHIAAQLSAFDAGGRRVTQDDVTLLGFRSARHLSPFVDGRFEQREGKPPPVGTPVKVRLRFQPLELTVPAGGRLVLGLSGGAVWPVFRQIHMGALPSHSGASVRVLHDCEHPSVLRFVTPREHSRLLNVREPDEPAGQPLASSPGLQLAVDGGGLARARVCGAAPRRTDVLGPARPSGRE